MPRTRHRFSSDMEAADAVRWWKKRLESPLFAYFIQDGDDGAVKIGKAYNPITRLSELQCGNPRELRLRSVVLAHHCTEENLHATWAEYRARGEWFGGASRYKVYGYVRILPPNHPNVQAEILRLAHIAQTSQINAALAGAPEPEIQRITDDTVTPPRPWIAEPEKAAA